MFPGKLMDEARHLDANGRKEGVRDMETSCFFSEKYHGISIRGTTGKLGKLERNFFKIIFPTFSKLFFAKKDDFTGIGKILS